MVERPVTTRAPDDNSANAEFVSESTSARSRRIETGITELPRNSGERRTESKKALLRAIKDAGGQW